MIILKYIFVFYKNKEEPWYETILIDQWKRTLDRGAGLCIYGTLVYENHATSNQQIMKTYSTNYVGTLGYTFGEKKLHFLFHTIPKVNFRCKVLNAKKKL